MAKTHVFFVVLLGLFFTENVICLDFCGAEDIPKCNRHDEDCIKTKLEPGLRKWIIKGQPGYFMEQVDPMTFNELPVQTKKGVYTLKNVKLSGFSEAKLLESKPDFVNNTFKYSYLYNFELLAEDFIDQNGKSLLEQRPLTIQLGSQICYQNHAAFPIVSLPHSCHFKTLIYGYHYNLQSATETNFVIVKRCEKEHIKFSDSKVIVKFINEENVNLKSGFKNADLDLKQAIGQIVGSSATTKIALNFRTLVTIVPMSAFYL